MSRHNEILMLPPEEHNKQKLKRKEDQEQLVQDIADRVYEHIPKISWT